LVFHDKLAEARRAEMQTRDADNSSTRGATQAKKEDLATTALMNNPPMQIAPTSATNTEASAALARHRLHRLHLVSRSRESSIMEPVADADAVNKAAESSEGCANGASTSSGTRAHVNNDFCEVCQSGGRLLLCERCPRAFHGRCIERFVELEGLARCSEWSCPVCVHGVDVLRVGCARPQLDPKEMEARMSEANKLGRKQWFAARRRRDLFLSLHQDLIEPFATRDALRRIGKAASALPMVSLEIGSRVRAAIEGEDQCCEAVILRQQSERRFLIAKMDTREEAELDRSCIAPLDDAPLGVDPGEKFCPGGVCDFLAHARQAVTADGMHLKDYQRAGVNWLIHGFYNRCGGILADDMGLGKTIQALAYLSYLRSSGAVSGPFLVVVPLSCSGNWVREAKRFVPHLSVSKICGTVKEREYCLDDDEIWYGVKDIVITTYETLVSSADYFLRHCWSVLLLDEAHRIKSQASNAREVLDSVSCASRLLLTGTPLQNTLGELFSLMRFLWPDVLTKESEVFENAVVHQTLEQDESVVQTTVNAPLMERIRSMLQMLMLRRRKEEVIRLPPKVIYNVWLPLSTEQVTWYRMLLKCRGFIQGRGLRALLKLMVRLRMLSGHPRCLALSKVDREQLASYGPVDKVELEKVSEGLRMSEEVVSHSGKLAFLDKLLGHLHAQNMGINARWHKAFLDRKKRTEKELVKADKESRKAKVAQQKDAEKEKKQMQSTKQKAWLKSAESLLFLDEMRPWQPAADIQGASSGSGGTAQESIDTGLACAAKDTQGAEQVNQVEDDAPRPHKVLIFSQFHACLDLLEAWCAWRGWRYLRLDGATSRVLRELDMRDFNSYDEDYFVYLIGTRAGGLGINLASANHVVVFDQDWNPHVDNQAIDRAHRIGQHRKVTIYRLVQEWGIEERLADRQLQKLELERRVVNVPDCEGSHDFGDAEDEAVPGGRERLTGEEVIALLKYGEQVMQQFDGESIDGMSLKELLERGHRPLPLSSPNDRGACAIEAQTLDAAYVEDEGEDASHMTPLRHEEQVEVAARAPSLVETLPAPPPSLPVPDTGANVVRTSSGRIVRRPQMLSIEVSKPVVKKDPIKHDVVCFACGKGPRSKLGRPTKTTGAKADAVAIDTHESVAAAAEVFCGICPKSYHTCCLGPSDLSQLQKRGRQWSCGWHSCAQCGRSAGACGGMLIHCLHCPSALCYDCFPPNFRRVYAPDKFWFDLQSRGWKVTPKKMVFFQCNCCRALEEQRLRQLMRAEDLEVQQDEKKRAALEEKRNLAAAKQRIELEESRMKMRQILLDHERAQFKEKLEDRRRELLSSAESLWPPVFRAMWLAHCSDHNGALVAKRASKQASSRKGKPAANALKAVEMLTANLRSPLAVCQNCGFPGHSFRVCPLPPEKIGFRGDPTNGSSTASHGDGLDGEKAECNGDRGANDDDLQEDGSAVVVVGEGEFEGGKLFRKNSNAKAGVYRRVCSICKSTTHGRIVCPQLTPQQRNEYEERGRALADLAVAFGAAGPVGEPLMQAIPAKPALSDVAVLTKTKRELECRLEEKVQAALKQCGLDRYIVSPPPQDSSLTGTAKIAQPKGEAKAKAKAKKKAKRKAVPEAKAKVQGVANPKMPKISTVFKRKAKISGGADSGTGPSSKKAKMINVTDDKEHGVDSAGSKKKQAKQPRLKEERVIVEGAAAGYTVCGTAGVLNGAVEIKYRPPQIEKWYTQAQGKAEFDEAVWSHLDAERGALLDLLKKRSRQAAKKPKPSGPKQPVPSVTQNPPVTEMREICDGPAKGWIVRGKINNQKQLVFHFKPPDGSAWLMRRAAVKVADQPVFEALEKERLDIQGMIRDRFMSQSKEEVEHIRSSSQKPSRSMPAIGLRKPGAEMKHIHSGAAANYHLRCSIPARGVIRWSFRRPQSTRFERLSSVQPDDLGLAVYRALQAEMQTMDSGIAQAVKKNAGPKVHNPKVVARPAASPSATWACNLGRPRGQRIAPALATQGVALPQSSQVLELADDCLLPLPAVVPVGTGGKSSPARRKASSPRSKVPSPEPQTPQVIESISSFGRKRRLLFDLIRRTRRRGATVVKEAPHAEAVASQAQESEMGVVADIQTGEVHGDAGSTGGEGKKEGQDGHEETTSDPHDIDADACERGDT